MSHPEVLSIEHKYEQANAPTFRVAFRVKIQGSKKAACRTEV
jgi:hypothetical protein